MEVEIKDLRENHESIEETARRELGYIKRDETFVRVIEKEDK
jgi:cell division protein FtsB